MTPRRLRLAGFRAFADLDLELPAGCVGVVGENGAGKSSLVIAVEIALFGPESRSLAPFVKSGGDELLVELELEHGGRAYKVRRTHSAKGRGKSTLDFEARVWTVNLTPSETPGEGNGDLPRFESGDGVAEWEPLTRASAAETQELITQTLGLTRETWRASAYLAQGDGSAFTAAQPRDRKRILADALNLGQWETARDAVAQDRRQAEQREQEIQARTSVLEEQAARGQEAERTAKTLTLELTVCEEDLAAAATLVAALDGRAQEAAKAASEHELAAAAVRTCRAEAVAQRRIGTEAQVARERADGVRTELASVERLYVEHQDVTSAVARAEQADRERAEALRAQRELSNEWSRLSEETRRQEQLSAGLEEKLAALDVDNATCDRCGQTLGTARETAQASLRAELAASEAATADLHQRTATAFEALNTINIPAAVEGLAQAKARLAEISDTPARLAMLRAQIAALEDTIGQADTPEYRDELLRLDTELEEAETRLEQTEPPEPGLADRLRGDLQDARQHHAEITGARDRLRTDQARAQQIWEQAAAAQTRIDEHTSERAQLAGLLGELSVLERAFGRDGVPAHIVENVALPMLEDHARAYLAVLGGPVSHIELRTERALKGGGTADALDIVCVTDDAERDYETFSGGEQTRLDVALRLALAELLANRRGAESKWLCIDEPSGLDEQGMAALVDVLRDLEQRGVFDSIVLVSHIPALRDAFDTTLTVQRDGNGSEVVVA